MDKVYPEKESPALERGAFGDDQCTQKQQVAGENIPDGVTNQYDPEANYRQKQQAYFSASCAMYVCHELEGGMGRTSAKLLAKRTADQIGLTAMVSIEVVDALLDENFHKAFDCARAGKISLRKARKAADKRLRDLFEAQLGFVVRRACEQEITIRQAENEVDHFLDANGRLYTIFGTANLRRMAAVALSSIRHEVH